MKNLKIEIVEPCAGYELLDSGEGEKLERYGQFVLSRPDPQALWLRQLPLDDWKKADAYFYRTGEKAGWKIKMGLPKEWEIEMAGLKFQIRPTSFKHTGLFPEQAANWKWIKQKVSTADRPIKVLNLFGYTGGATLASLSGGAEVTHVDGSKTAVNWAQKNMELSGLKDKPGRFLVDDARGFVQREIRRNSKYDAIIMDPPAFGRGAKDEIWKIEEDLIPLLESCQKILSDNPLFIIVNGYSAGYSALAYENVLEPIVKKYGGKIEIGELTLAEKSGRLLPAGIFARWTA